MTTLREAAQQALEALEYGQHTLTQISENQWESRGQLAMQALRAALAEPAQAPVAWYFEARHIDSAWAAAVTMKHPGPEGKYMRKVTPLYPAPPQRSRRELARRIVALYASTGDTP